MNYFKWEDKQIPHLIWAEKLTNSKTRLCLKVIKDVEPEMLSLDLDVCKKSLADAWQGCAVPVSTRYQDSHLYSQVRCLFNLLHGCVVWMVNHIQLPDGNKMSADKLAFIPEMKQDKGILVAI